MIRPSLVSLALAALLAGPAAAETRIELVLDASKGMQTELENGRPRIDAARRAVGDWIAEQGQQTLSGVGLLAIGGSEDSEVCSHLPRLIEPGQSNLEAWGEALTNIQPAGSRALIQAVTVAAETLTSEVEAGSMIVITSGEDDCDGDGEAAAAALAHGIGLRIIGIGLADEAVTRFSAVAPTSNATDRETLLNALRMATEEILAEHVVLEVPSEVVSGRFFEVIWEGPCREADFISVSDPGSEGGTYLDLHFVEDGSPATLAAPANPGGYEVRYVDGRKGAILRQQDIVVTVPPIVIEAPTSVRAGERFEVRWIGPNAAGDFIAVAPEEGSARRHPDWVYTSIGSPATMAAPYQPGAFEIRYISGATKEVLAAIPLTVER